MESPIEIQLRNAIRALVPSGTMLDDFTESDERFSLVDRKIDYPSEYQAESLALGSCDPDEVLEMVAMYSKVHVLSYRADIVIIADANSGDFPFVVECDGHDYHNTTKQQAAYDRSRDRELLLAGIPTIRFTGSEIHHDADRCASQVWALVKQFQSQRDERIESDIRQMRIGARLVTPISPLEEHW